uniref:Uncharacterized protein n=1 Tax=Helianthus annuus TaxID=4232 RepID=A0A251S677_HELAN
MIPCVHNPGIVFLLLRNTGGHHLYHSFLLNSLWNTLSWMSISFHLKSMLEGQSM